ncbi:hypothetical protein B0H14DRAFT_2590332 [Mycena olivaceomarginata]|nr:hypothetical protein B0H14DRAFT_2590332 [Mycena olivaceomarginata]
MATKTAIWVHATLNRARFAGRRKLKDGKWDKQRDKQERDDGSGEARRRPVEPSLLNGWAADGACWYTSTDPREVLRWVIGTQTVWILLSSVGEVGAFLIILGYLIVNEGGETLELITTHWKLDTRGFRTDTQLGATYTSEASRRAGLYPLVACLLTISTAVLDLYSEQKKLSMQGFVIDLAILAGRPLIYVLLAATDPSFIRAIRAIRHPEFELGTGPLRVWRSGQQTMPTGCLSTVVIDMPPNDVKCEPGWSRKEPTREQSPTATGTSSSSAEEWNTGADRGQGGIAMNLTPTQPGAFSSFHKWDTALGVGTWTHAPTNFTFIGRYGNYAQ